MDIRGSFASQTAPGEAPRILVIEPNRNYLGLLARRLGEAGFRVSTATGAQSGMSELHRLPADLILCELRLKGTSGVELVRMIREDAVHRDLPVMLITGRSEPSAPVRAYEAGADDVILKPFHFEVLVARIFRRLERAQAVEALRHDNAALDARVVTRAIELGEMRDRWVRSETERRRLEAMVQRAA